VINLKVSERTGHVVAIMTVTEDDQIMVITRQGVVNRQRVSEISVIGRATQGVKLVNLDEGDSVVDVAWIVQDEEDDEVGDLEDIGGEDEVTPAQDGSDGEGDADA
jgi:DNA gyrase subunit A